MVWGMQDVDGSVPGTVSLDSSADGYEMDDRAGRRLKTASGRNSHIVLSPQPSDDPNDPLNWPQWRKNLLLVLISLVATLTNAIGPMVSTAFRQISSEYGISIDAATSATGGTFSLTVGLTTFLSTAGAVKYGKRPMFILSTFFLIVFSIWANFAPNVIHLAIARALQGVAAAPFETLVSSTVADLFFVHERGSKLAIWGLSIGAGLAISQVGGGAVVQYLGWKKLFLITAVCFSAMFLLVLFMVPETAYNRVHQTHPLHSVIQAREAEHEKRSLAREDYERQENQSTVSSVYSAIPPASRVYDDSFPDQLRRNTAAFLASRLADVQESPPPTRSSPAKTYWQTLTFIPRETFSTCSFWKLAFRPIPLFVYPAVLFTSLVNGLNYVFLLAFGLASLSLFAATPYNLQPVGIGMTALPAVIAASIGQPLAGWATDYIARKMTRQNGGVYEPEMRLISMLPSTLFATIGFIGFGQTIHTQQVLGHGSIFVPLSWYALIAFSVPWTNVAAFSYLIDSHTEVANEAFVTTHFAKGLMMLIVASTLNGFLEKYGVLKVFLVIAGVNFGASCFTVVFWVYGKRMRAWVARNRALQKF